MEPFIAQIMLFAGNFAIRSWAFCRGQLLAISQNTALFSLVGTIYGGNGRTTFGLPDLRGRAAIGFDQGPGLSSYSLGQKGGAENVTLNTTQIPSHTHVFAGQAASTQDATSSTPGGGLVPAKIPGVSGGPNSQPVLAYGSAADTSLAAGSTNPIANTGGSQPHENRMPYLALNYLIALQGVFPSRS